jgi:hypothetical protein
MESDCGLDASVQASGECAFERASDIAVGLAVGTASNLVGTGLGMASHPGDGHGVQGTVQRSVAAAIESMAGVEATAHLEWSDTGQRRERSLVADPAAMRPTDQQLRGDHGADAGLGEQCGSCRMLLDELKELWVKLGELHGQEPNPRRDRLQREHRQALFDGCCLEDLEALDAVELTGEGLAAQLARRCSGATTIKLFSSLIAFVRLNRTPSLHAKTMRRASRRPPDLGAPCSSRPRA